MKRKRNIIDIIALFTFLLLILHLVIIKVEENNKKRQEAEWQNKVIQENLARQKFYDNIRRLHNAIDLYSNIDLDSIAQSGGI